MHALLFGKGRDALFLPRRKSADVLKYFYVHRIANWIAELGMTGSPSCFSAQVQYNRAVGEHRGGADWFCGWLHHRRLFVLIFNRAHALLTS